ncbi:TetR/AcrR family transcriptional regulator [Nocardiopsis kunsanensis]|uniref:TetR family transcriptional regulator n=1 Tax=Nocardiopsis kunsanensis TaxID=141693 RepID=A0A918X7M4_9ACTN|nr:TetR/AcrR family transcriptional regulator [Nocardiopsis kunsanensis]GHD17092.1 TetR family transcriptional regulator [Nocardiopsis kunsanensis]
MTPRRTAILSAAAKLFQANGIHTTAVEDITRESGISKGAFYKHFGSKDDLILELLQRFCDEMFQQEDLLSSTHRGPPLLALKRILTAQLETLTDYQNFMHAVAMDFPPHSAGPIPEAMGRLTRDLHALNERVLLAALGPEVRPYVADLAVVLEGALHHYLMWRTWQGATLRLERIAGFLAECLVAIVTGDQSLSPVLSNSTGGAQHPSNLESMARGLTSARVAVQGATSGAPTAGADLQTIDLLLDELHGEHPREFLVDALLAQLCDRPYLTEHMTPIAAAWNAWKGRTE